MPYSRVLICERCKKEFTIYKSKNPPKFCPDCWERFGRRGLTQAKSDEAMAKNHDKFAEIARRNLPAAIAGVRASPLSGAFETHRRAKIWSLIAPWGEQFEVRNLTKFCRDHPDWFPAGSELAMVSFTRISGAIMRGLPYPNQYKGWILACAPHLPEESAIRLKEVEAKNKERERKRDEKRLAKQMKNDVKQ